MKEDLKKEINIPENVQVRFENKVLLVKGLKGEINRKLYHPSINLNIKDNTIIIECKKATKREQTLLYTFNAHIKNMLKGVQEPFIYTLRICAGPPQSHFPAQVTFKDSKLTVKNFLGEKIPRELKIQNNVKLEIKGNDILVESSDKEAAGRAASEIELLTKTRNKDRRIFQDGIYLVEKA